MSAGNGDPLANTDGRGGSKLKLPGKSEPPPHPYAPLASAKISQNPLDFLAAEGDDQRIRRYAAIPRGMLACQNAARRSDAAARIAGQGGLRGLKEGDQRGGTDVSGLGELSHRDRVPAIRSQDPVLTVSFFCAHRSLLSKPEADPREGGESLWLGGVFSQRPSQRPSSSGRVLAASLRYVDSSLP